jgi:hypothetical protein
MRGVWAFDDVPEAIAVTVGAFADPAFPTPTFSVYNVRRHPWAEMPGLVVEHYD